MEQAGISLGDAMNLCNRGGYDGYGSAMMWNNPFMYLMWASMFGNGGFGFGGRGADYVNQAQLAQGLDNQDKNSQLRGLANGICDSSYALNNAIKDNTGNVTTAINNLHNAMGMGFCTLGHGLENLKYENAKNTADIITNATANTQRIMDGICGLKMDAKDAQIAALSGQLADAKLNLSQVAQNAYLVEKLKPTT